MSGMMLRKLGASLALLGLVLVAGCSSRDGLVPVTGKVTFDGTPVDNGRILFKKKDRPGEAFSAPISQGNYEVRCAPGEMVVEITASRIIPGKFDRSNGTPEPVGEMYIPSKYNSATTLKAEVKRSGSNTVPFALTSR